MCVLLIAGWISMNQAVRVTSIKVPPAALYDQNVALDCRYQLTGDTLYSVKWYKDGYEFYRYIFADLAPIYTFPRLGLNVDVSQISRIA